MNWDAIGAIGEILGAITVIATLFYLARQIRQNTKAQTIATFESAMSGFNEVLRFSFTDLERTSISRRGMSEPESLSEDERVQHNAMIRHYTNHVYKLFRLYERDVFPENEWNLVAVEAKGLFDTPAGKVFRNGNKYFVDLWAELDKHKASDFTNFDIYSN